MKKNTSFHLLILALLFFTNVEGRSPQVLVKHALLALDANVEIFVCHNHSENIGNNNFIRIQWVDGKHEPGCGARISLHAGAEIQAYESTHVSGIYSISEPTVHFGLNKITKVDK